MFVVVLGCVLEGLMLFYSLCVIVCIVLSVRLGCLCMHNSVDFLMFRLLFCFDCLFGVVCCWTRRTWLFCFVGRAWYDDCLTLGCFLISYCWVTWLKVFCVLLVSFVWFIYCCLLFALNYGCVCLFVVILFGCGWCD